MPTTTQIADILFKKQLGLGTTSSGRLFFNEPIRGRSFVVQNQLWAQSNLIPDTAPATSTGVVQKLVDYPLTLVAGTTNSFTGALLQDTIPFNWGDGTSYNYTVKDSTSATIAFGVNDWVVDTEAGILMFNSGVPGNMPPTISFFRYSGSKGTDTGSFITTGQTGQFFPAANTGAFYSSTNPAGYITAGQISGTGVTYVGGLTANVGITGQGTVTVYTGAPNTLYISGSNANTVFTTGDQNISGVKTFLSSLAFTSLSGFGENTVINSDAYTIRYTGNARYSAQYNEAYDDANQMSVRFGARRLATSQEFASVLWDTGQLYMPSAGDNIVTVDWIQRILSGSWRIENLSGTGSFISTSQTGAFASSTNLTTISGRVDSVSGTTQALSGQTQGLQSQITTINNKTGTFVTTAQTGSFLTSISLSGLISTGDADVRYALAAKTGTFITTAQTGAFASTVNLNTTGTILESKLAIISGTTGAFITTSQTGAFASVVNLANTGSSAQSQINSIVSWTGGTPTIYAPIVHSHTGYIATGDADLRYALSAKTGAFITSAQTGVFVRTGEVRDVLLSGFTILNDIARLAPDQTGGMTIVYPNVGAFSTLSNTITGALVFNTPIYRTDNRRVSFLVQGGDSSQGVDTTSWFRVSTRIATGAGITGSDGITGAVISANMIALGDNNVPKWVGINKSGYLALAIGTTGYTQDYTRYMLDVWVGDENPTPIKTGWGWSLETGVNFGFLHLSGLTNSAPFLTGSQSSFVTTGQTGSFITTSMTGQFYASNNPQQFVSTGNADVRYALAAKTGTFVTTAQTGAFASTVNLATTGAFLQSEIVIISGTTGAFITTSQTGQFAPYSNTVFLTGNQTITGTKTFRGGVYTYGAVDVRDANNLTTAQLNLRILYDVGENSIFDWERRIISGVWTGQDLIISGFSVVTRGQTGNFITSVSGFITTGDADARYALAAKTGTFITSAQTGAFASSINLNTISGRVDSVSGSTQALSGQTQGLQSQINSIVSWTGGTPTIYASITHSHTGYIATGDADARYALAAKTGTFVTTAQTGAFASVVNLNTTGTIIESKLAIVSGTTGAFITTSQTGAFASVVNLASTGSSAQSQINSIVSWTGGTPTIYAALTHSHTGYIATGDADTRYALAAKTGTFITSAQTGVFVRTGETRDVWFSGFTILNDLAINSPNQSSQNTYTYPALSVYETFTNPVTGALIFNTPIARTDYKRVSFEVRGGDTSAGVNTTSWFRVTSRLSSGTGNIDGLTGAVIGANLVALGDNVVDKWIGINKSGNLALVIGSTGYVQDYSRYKVDVWVSDNATPVRTGWGWTIETGANFQFKDLSGLANSAPFLSGTVSSYVTTGQTGAFAAQITLASLSGNLSGQTFGISGQVANIIARTGGFVTTAQTGAFASSVDLNTLSGRINSVSGTTQNLSGQTQGLSGQIVTVQGLTTNLSGQTQGISGQVSYVQGLTTNLSGQTQGLSGQIVYVQNYATSVSGSTSALSGQTQGLQGQINTINNKTGTFITTAQTGAFASVVDLTQTGVILSGQIIALSGQVTTINNKTGTFITSAQTGAFASVVNLTATGATLSGQIVALSGQVTTINNKTGVFVMTGETRDVLLSGFNIINDLARLAPDQTGQMTMIYPNVGAFATDENSVTGALVFNTPIYRTDNRRVSFLVQGGDSSAGVDTTNWFRLSTRILSGVGVTGSDGVTGAVVSANLIALGDSTIQKWVGINKSGYLAFALGNTGYAQNWTRYMVDVWVGDNFPTPVKTGWGWSLETGVNFGFLHLSGLTNSVPFLTGSSASFITTGQTGAFAAQATLASLSGNLSGQTVNLSGQTAMIVAKTGTFITTAQTGAFASSVNLGTISGNLNTTGATLSGQIQALLGQVVSVSGSTQALSGQTQGLQSQINTINNKTGTFVTDAETGAFASTVNLVATGAFLQSEIVIISGTTGSFITTSQTGAFASAVNVSTISGRVDSVSGTTQALSGQTQGLQSQITTINNKTGVFITTAQTGAFYSSTNPSGYITAAQAGGVQTINVTGLTVSGTIILTGVSGVAVTSSGQTIFVAGQTGIFVTTSQTGAFASVVNLNTTGTIIESKLAIVSGTTGAFITNSQTGAFASVVNLASTGSSAQSQINSIVSWTGGTPTIYAALAHSHTGYIATGDADTRYALAAKTGTFVTTAQTGAFASVVNLTSTGAILSGQIIALSGYAVSISGSTVNLSGQTAGISGQVATIIARTGGFVTTAQTGQFYAINNPASFIRTGDADSRYYPIGTNPLDYLSGYQMSRTLPVEINGAVDIGTWSIANGTHNLGIYTIVADSNFSVSKSYLINSAFSVASFPNPEIFNVWKEVIPTTASPSWGTQDYALDASGSGSYLTLRLRRNQVGVQAGTVRIKVVNYGTDAIPDTFTPSTSSGLVAAPTSKVSWDGNTGIYYPRTGNPSGFLSASDETFVRTTGSQNITGTKTFNVPPIIYDVPNHTLIGDLASRILYTDTETSSIDWNTRQLLGPAASLALDWSVNKLTGQWSAQAISLSGYPVVTSNQALINDGTFVRTTGNQTITGNKIFYSSTSFSGNSADVYVVKITGAGDGGFYGHGQLGWYNTDGNLMGALSDASSAYGMIGLIGDSNSPPYMGEFDLVDKNISLSDKRFFVIQGLYYSPGYAAVTAFRTGISGAATSFNYTTYQDCTGRFGISAGTSVINTLEVGNMGGRNSANVAIGSSYVNVVQAPVNGMIVQGRVGFGTGVPSAMLHIGPKTGNTGFAPIKLSSSSLLTTPESGVIEYDGTNFYLTNNNLTRSTITTGVAMVDDGTVVRTTGSQIIGGFKRFTGEHSFSGNSFGNIALKISGATGQLADLTAWYSGGGQKLASVGGTGTRIRVNEGFTTMQMGGHIGAEATYGGIWFTNSPTTNLNYLLLVSTASTFVNAPSSAVEMRVANVTKAAFGASGLIVGGPGSTLGNKPLIISGTSENAIFFCVSTSGRIGVNLTGTGAAGGININPSAQIHISGGSVNKSSAPIKIESGFLMTTPEAGAVEYNGTNFYVTNHLGSRTAIATGASAGVNSLVISGGQSYAGNITITGTNGIAISGSGQQILFDATNRRVVTPRDIYVSPTTGAGVWWSGYDGLTTAGAGPNSGDWWIDWRSGENFSYTFRAFNASNWIWLPNVYMTGCIEAKTIYVSFINTGANTPASSTHPFGWKGEPVYWTTVAGAMTWVNPTGAENIDGQGSASSPSVDLFMFRKINGMIIGTKLAENAKINAGS